MTRDRDRLKKRAEFLAVARGRKVPRRGFVLQYAVRSEGAGSTAPKARFGFTVTKRNGNSVERNRIRRRLKEAVRLAAAEIANPACDHVLVGRREGMTLAFADLVADLAGALRASRRPQKTG